MACAAQNFFWQSSLAWLQSLLLGLLFCGSHSNLIAQANELVFARDIAPIIIQNCSQCHRPGEPAPFSLLNYNDVFKHRDQVLEVIESGIMPPWMPAPQKHRFANERRLPPEAITKVKQWIINGAPEGNPEDLPPLPHWVQGWSLGEPDLILTLPQPYEMSAEGTDIYRNFVFPVSITNHQQVAGLEFRPGNGKVVHHAFIRIDSTHGSRSRDAGDPEPGFSGLHAPGTMPPEGFFASWQPGKTASRYPQGLSWTLHPGEDLVVQTHLRHSGKPEKVQPQIGIYFTKSQPKTIPLKLYLQTTQIKIPAGSSNYSVTDKLTLPVDVAVIGILPHAHYLARSVTVTAFGRRGSPEQLLNILRWDFNWQGDYTYEKPVFLQRGSTIEMRWTYDNSSANPNNPSKPPRDVHYGLQSTDEMAEVWLQVLVRSKADYDQLDAVVSKRIVTDTIAYNEFILKAEPTNATAWFELGKALTLNSQPGRAEESFKKSLELKPSAEACFNLGLLMEMQNRVTDAQKAYEQCLALEPDNYLAHNNLGLILLNQNKLEEAISHFRRAVEFSHGDTLPRENLELALNRKKSTEQ